jgi:hypothetical protein
MRTQLASKSVGRLNDVDLASTVERLTSEQGAANCDILHYDNVEKNIAERFRIVPSLERDETAQSQTTHCCSSVGVALADSNSRL